MSKRAVIKRPVCCQLGASLGFTLIEALVAVAILSLAMGVIGSGFSQVFSFQTSFKDDAVATKDLRHAGSWFAGDALNAKIVLDNNGSPLACGSAATSVTLTWSGSDGTVYSSIYRVSGDSLERVYDGAANVLARRVVPNSIGFSLCGNLLTMDLELEAEPETTEIISLQTYLRKLE